MIITGVSVIKILAVAFTHRQSVSEQRRY